VSTTGILLSNLHHCLCKATSTGDVHIPKDKKDIEETRKSLAIGHFC